MDGKVVAIIGPARCGKSYLTKKLSNYYSAPSYLEGEEKDFPAEIVNDLKHNIRPLERFIYFRNRSASNLLSAFQKSKTNRYVFLDTCWLTNRPWLDVYATTPLERSLLRGICDIDDSTQPWPAAVIYLTADVTTSRRLMNGSGRSFDPFFDEQMLRSKEMFKEYIATLRGKVPLIEIDRSGLEFDLSSDLEKVTTQLEATG